MRRRAWIWASSVALTALGSCTPTGTTTPLRSLERSGPIAVVCMGPNGTEGPAGLPLSACSTLRGEDATDFELDDGTKFNHLYALVLQMTRGEVAVVDLSASVGNVIDADLGIPGSSFLPVGGMPVDIVATDGGTAAFVAVGDVGREGIFALPTSKIRRCGSITFDDGTTGTGGQAAASSDDCFDVAPTLTSWPACSLPVAPGAITLGLDAPDATGAVRATCDGPYEVLPPPADPTLDLFHEGRGAQKLVVSLPALGGIVVVDAQALLAREAGSFDPCPVERWVPFEPVVPDPPPPPPPPPNDACVQPQPPDPQVVTVPPPKPSALARSGDRLFVGDLAAPLIHAVRMESACDPVVEPPLLPRSVLDPTRVVTASKLAATPAPTTDLARFLYAVDAQEGSLMVFDVSDGATSRVPLQRERPEILPLQPPDRIRFSAPVSDLVLFTRDAPITNPATGIAEEGVRCSPDPSLDVCFIGATNCDPETLYRTVSTFDAGAGPTMLRGTFAFAALTSGQLVAIDIDDLDSLCRQPKDLSPALGCPAGGYPGLPTSGLVSTGEASCEVVARHEPRSAQYVLSDDVTLGRHEPGLQTFPLLFAPNGTILPLEDVRMVAVVPEDGTSLHVSVGSETIAIAPDGTALGEPDKHVLTMHLEDPRAHVSDQFWTVAYEGKLPRLTNRTGRIDMTTPPEARVIDAAARFCDGGAMSKAAAKAMLAVEGETSDAAARALADVVQITTTFLEREDPYWTTSACTYDDCLATFGTPIDPSAARDTKVLEAYQDVLYVEQPSDPEAIDCCFPGVIQYDVRAGSQWVAVGSSTGFVHKVIADPETGYCRVSCDPNLSRLNGRVRPSPDPVVKESSPYAFIGPFFRFGIFGVPERDSSFRFTVQGSFQPLAVPLNPDGVFLLPNSVTYVGPNGALLVADGLFEGLVLVDTATVALTARYF